MQGGYIAETDDGFGDLRHSVYDTLQSISPARTKNEVHRRIMERIDEVRQPVFIPSGKASPFIARVRAFAHFISPRAQARSRPVDV